jgi:hypothetical protein
MEPSSMQMKPMTCISDRNCIFTHHPLIFRLSLGSSWIKLFKNQTTLDHKHRWLYTRNHLLAIWKNKFIIPKKCMSCVFKVRQHITDIAEVPGSDPLACYTFDVLYALFIMFWCQIKRLITVGRSRLVLFNWIIYGTGIERLQSQFGIGWWTSDYSPDCVFLLLRFFNKNRTPLSPSCIDLSFDGFGSNSWHSIWYFRLFPTIFGLPTFFPA